MNSGMKENYFLKNPKNPLKTEASTMDNLIRVILSQRDNEKEGKE
jgi:hypothetical protein